MMSSKLSDHLGVDLPKDVLTTNPRFKDLLSALNERLSKDCISKDVLELSDSIKSDLMQKKKNYFSKLILYNEIESILLDRKFNFTSDSKESQDKFWDMFVDSNIQEFLANSEVKPFGLKDDNFVWSIEDKMALDMQIVLAELESNLRKKCETVANVYNLPSDDDDDKIVNSSNLPHLVDKNLKELKMLKKNLSEQTSKRILLFNRFCEYLIKCFKVLANILKTHRIQKIPDNNIATIKWIVNHCEALCLKTKMMELQLQSETYTKDALKALKVIKKELDKNTHDTRQELKQANALLNSYSSLGQEFQSIVNDFAKVKKEIDNRKWALGQLK